MSKSKQKRGLLSVLRKQEGQFDLPFFAVVIILVSVGLVMLFSASHAYAFYNKGNSTHFISRQVLFAVAGVVAMLVISRLNFEFWQKKVWLVFGLALVLLIIVLLIPPYLKDFRRWIYFGPVNFQPSEIAKFAVIIVMAHFISLNYRNMNKMRYVFAAFFLFVVPVALLTFFEPHLSATIIICLIAALMLIIGGANLKWISIGVVCIAVAAAVAILAANAIDYATSRFQYWLDPWSDPQGKGWQTIQSLYAIGSGGFMGQGFGQSRQKFLYVSEPQNDFIFAIVCEELGFVGATIIVLLFAFFVYRGFVIASRAKTKFGALLVLGITLQVGLQVVLNMMVVTNTIPNTGISLPFFSYGGTSLMMLLGEMGVVLSVSRSSMMHNK